jgi:predicted enzyme related to lactoylglutathione lyase
VKVDDVAHALERVKELGGSALMGPMDMPTAAQRSGQRERPTTTK